MNRTRTLIPAFVAVLAMMAIALPAHAGTVSGSLEFACTADLPVVPNVDPTREGTCDGDGTVNGSASGLADDGWEYVATIVGGDISATFSYDQRCTANEPLEGTADGQVSVTGGTAVKGGIIVSADLHADFNWDRVGSTAWITLTNVVIEFGDGTTASALADGQAQAAFVPTPLPDCLNPQPITAEVAGTAEFIF